MASISVRPERKATAYSPRPFQYCFAAAKASSTAA